MYCCYVHCFYSCSFEHLTVTFGETIIFKIISYYNSVIRLQTGNQHNLVLQPKDSMDEHRDCLFSYKTSYSPE